MTGVPTFVPVEEDQTGVFEVDPAKVLFIGAGSSAVGWYRCYLPAMFIGADWIGVAGEPPHLRLLTGLVKGATQLPRYEGYDVIVIQQPRGRGWLKLIRGLQERGVKVVYEVDDYLHGIKRMQDHDFADYYGKQAMADVELCMRACDAMICSTPYIARRYRQFNRNIHVCLNGVDTARYALTRPPRPTVNVGWSGATGHTRSALPWLEQVGNVLIQRDNACFVSIGQDFASMFRPAFGPERVISVPFSMIETYPSAMTLFDVAIAPAGKGAFFLGKSDLRWCEAGALGIPIVADPTVYPNIVHGETGFHAATPTEARELVLQLIDDPDLRTRIGDNAKAEVLASRDMRVMAPQWLAAFASVLGATIRA